jgi:colicin import membrane protein
VPTAKRSSPANGALAREPRLRNPPSDPSLMPLAESALRAVKTCNPLRVPAQFQPYYNEWKDRILRFDPEEMMG